MTHLDELARRIAELHGGLRLRPAVETAVKLGELLSEVRAALPHGAWTDWVRSRCPHISSRTARVYLQLFFYARNRQFPADMTLDRMLSVIRQGRRAEIRARREEVRAEVAGRGGTLVAGVTLVHADCRRYSWPVGVDCVVADPPWADVSAYSWVGEYAGRHLREGGLALVQCGVPQMPQVLDVLRGHLRYVWVLAWVYQHRTFVRPVSGFLPGWRCVLVFSRGVPDLPGPVQDTQTVGHAPQEYHDWQQPVEPWAYWLERLTRPGALVADPYAGSGTVGVACHRVGRRYLGCEADRQAYRVARGRLAGLR